MASCLRHLEHLPHQVHEEICKLIDRKAVYYMCEANFNHGLFLRVGRSWRELEIYLNKQLTAAQPSLLKVRSSE